jgi:hypothetical protein
MIFQITEAVPRRLNMQQSRGKKSVKLSHAALLWSHCLGNTINYKGFPKHFQHFLYFIQSQQEKAAVFSVINYKCPICFCSNMEQYVSSHMHRVIKMVWYGDVYLKQWALLNFLWQKKKSVTNIHKQLQQ